MTAGGATLVVPAGAVTGQVIAHLKIPSTSVLQAVTPSARLMLKSVGEAVEVDLSGQQPLRPLTLTLRVTGAADHPALAIITNHQGTASVLTGALSADHHSYTVKVSKLSVFQLVALNPSAVLKTFNDGIKVALGTLGVYGDKPSCFGQSATLPDGGRVKVTGVRGPLWPCVSAVGNGVKVTVHSVDTLPWQVRARAGDYVGAAEADGKAAAVQAIYAALASDRAHADGLVLPQGEGQWMVPVAELPVDMAGKISTGAWLSSAVVFSVLYLADAASFGRAGDAKTLAKGFQQAIGGKASGWDCVVSAAKVVPDGAPPSTGQLVALLQAAVACAGPLAKPVLGSDLGGLATLALDIVGGGAAVVVGGFEGVLRMVTGTDTTTWQVSSLQPVPAPVNAAGHGPTERGLDVSPPWIDLIDAPGFARGTPPSGVAGQPGTACSPHAGTAAGYRKVSCTTLNDSFGLQRRASLGAGRNWVICQADLARANPVYRSGQTNTWWFWTLGDTGGWDWFPETALSEGDSDNPVNGIALCLSGEGVDGG